MKFKQKNFRLQCNYNIVNHHYDKRTHPSLSWNPRAQLKQKFYDGSSVSFDKPDIIEEFYKKYTVEEKYVREYVNHLLVVQQLGAIHKNQAKQFDNTIGKD